MTTDTTTQKRPRAPAIYPPDYEARTVELARRMLDDIPECAAARFAVQWIAGAPVLVVVFTQFAAPDGVIPAFMLRLVCIPRSAPLQPGSPLEGERLRRALRSGLEDYMLRHGIRVPIADD